MECTTADMCGVPYRFAKQGSAAWVNGDLVNHGTQCTATKGQIALQAEGSEVEFRKLSLVPITMLSND
jgi:hypothetical protein